MTSDAVAARLCELEGGTAAMLLSSGQAASFFSVFNIASAGDHVVSSATIYGGTYNLFAVTMKRMGIDFTFVDPDCSEEELQAAFRPNTKAVFGETIANPSLVVLDIEKFARVAHKNGVPLIVDTRATSTGRPMPTSSPASPPPMRATTAWCILRPSARAAPTSPSAWCS